MGMPPIMFIICRRAPSSLMPLLCATLTCSKLPSQRPKLGKLEVARFVNPQFSTLIGAPRDSKVQTIVFPNLPIISTGVRANLAGDLCDAFVVIGIDLLVDENETFSTGNVNPLTSGVVCHVTRVGGTGQTGM